MKCILVEGNRGVHQHKVLVSSLRPASRYKGMSDLTNHISQLKLSIIKQLSRKDLHRPHTTKTSTAGGGALGFVEQNHGLHKIKREQGFYFDSRGYFNFSHLILISPLLSFEPVIICCDIIHRY